MTAVQRLQELVCGGADFTFRHSRHPFPGQATWDLLYTSPSSGYTVSVGCVGCEGLPPDTDAETLARAELAHIARKMRRDAEKARKEQAKTLHKIDQLTGYAARCGVEAAKLEAQAAELESV